ncbi:MAG TPA: permease-like cell division protein FtsX [Ignavibacteriaceae bacterium]|nr:permease-like cell division protein FtsX [Ignavibacteriaceae bacterium]
MIFFWIRESLKSIKRARSSFFLSLISMSIAVILITASFFSLYIAGEFQKRLKKNVYLNIFVQDSITAIDLDSLELKLKAKEYTGSIKFIDKNKAAEIFIGETGEDFRKLLDYNPLPASFALVLKDPYVQKDSIKKIASSIAGLRGVDEVKYKSDFIDKLLAFLNDFNKYLFTGTAVIFFIAVYIVYSTVKLVIGFKAEELETMKLVGAKLSSIKMPVILNAVWIGFFSSIISSVLILLFIHYIQGIDYSKVILREISLYLILLLLIGPLLGFLISSITLRKVTLKSSSH